MKDFDRHIERSMNEYAVAPPFGMWNRIQNELDGTAEPVAAPTNTAPLVPRGVLMGFISGAALISVLVGGFLFYNKQTPALNENTSALQANAVQLTQQSQPVVSQLTPAIKEEKSEVVVASAPVKKQLSISSPAIKEESNAVVNGGNQNQLIANSESTIAAEQTTETKSEEAYYFPPVDINTGDAKDEHVVDALYRGYNTAEPNADPKTTEVKKSKSSSSNVKFKKKKKSRGGFSYGRLNRLKPSK